MMLLKFKCSSTTVLAFLIVQCYVLSINARLNIERGERDVFDNPKCDSPTGVGYNCTCDGLNATCADSPCKKCICSSNHRTFLHSNDTNNGRCVKNRHLLFIPEDGCYEFVNPLSAVLLTAIRKCPQQCLEEREISLPHKSGESLCYVMWEKLQYLHNDQWKQLPFREEIFIVDKRNTSTFLQLNCTKSTNDSIGLIVKLYFYCAEKKLASVNITDIKCVVVKFKDPPSVHATSTVPAVHTTFTGKVSNPTSTPEKSKNDSSNALTIIVVCVVIAILILCVILGFIFYKRRRCSERKKNAVMRSNADVHTELVVTLRKLGASKDCGYAIPYIKKAVSPDQAGASTSETHQEKRWNNIDVEHKAVTYDPAGYVIPTVTNTESPDKARSFAVEPRHENRCNNRGVEGSEIIDDSGYEILPEPDMKKSLSLEQASALFVEPEGEQKGHGHGGYVEVMDTEDEMGYVIPDVKTTRNQDVSSHAENENYSELLKERYEHVYQGLLPATNPTGRSKDDLHMPSRDDHDRLSKGTAIDKDHDSAENEDYQSLETERYEHVYQGLLPTTNR